MIARRNLSLVLAVVLLLAVASPAFGDMISPTLYFWPGVVPLMLGLAVPASVLAAVLERPFVSRAGVDEYALWYSLQANCISMMLGFLALPVGIFGVYMCPPLWSMIAVAGSCISEGYWYRWVAIPQQKKMSWLTIVGANLFSSFVLAALPDAALALKEVKPDLKWVLAPYQDTLYWGCVGASGLLFIASFFVPEYLRSRKRRARTSSNSPAPGETAIQGTVDIRSLYRDGRDELGS